LEKYNFKKFRNMKKKSNSIDELLNITKCEVLSQEELRTIAGGMRDERDGSSGNGNGGGVKDGTIYVPPKHPWG
jgi:hypothetical protein